MRHEMKLGEGPFSKIQNGIKKFEIRLYDEKRKAVRPGDTIRFFLLSDSSRFVDTEVLGILIYSNFSELFEDIDPRSIGYKEEDREYLKTSMYEIYTQDEEKMYGAMGIKIKLKKEYQ